MLVKNRSNIIFPSFVDTFFGNDILNGYNDTAKYSQPALNIGESEHFFRVEIAFPGVEKERFEIDVNENILSVKVKQPEGNAENTTSPKVIYSKREFNFAGFTKQFILPENVEIENINAEHKNGILLISIAKKAEVKIEPRKININ